MSPETTDIPDRPLRSDAARNRARVVSAALEVFAEQGLDATMPEVAARAGVGKATVYRSFPTREALVASIVVERLAWYRETVEACTDEPDAWQAFANVMYAAAELQAKDRAMAACFAAASDDPEVLAAKDAATAALDAIMRRAQAQGTMRPGIDAGDLRVLFGGIGRVLNADEYDAASWRRATALMIDAFRAEGTPQQQL